MPDAPGHLTPAEFREHGHAVIDWIADYWDRVGTLPVRSQAKPGDTRAALAPHPPEQAESMAAILADLDTVILPGVTHWQHPSFFAYFPANSSPAAVLGDLVSTGLGVQGMLWATSPAATELEQHVLDWMVELLGLPAHFLSTGSGGGVIQDSASSATLCALIAARERALRTGATSPSLRCYASSQAHSSVEKALRIVGLPPEQLRIVGVDAACAMDPARLAEMMAADAAAGLTPALVVASVGSTGTTAIDPVAAVARVAAEHGAWVHVDAAYAGVAAVRPDLRWLHDGVEAVDSYVTNPHKWLLTSFDCSTFWVRDRVALTSALTVLPEYLRNAATEAGAVVDFRDWQVPLGRRFRSLKLWFVLRSYGAQGLRDYIGEHVAWAQELAGWAQDDSGWEVPTPHPLSTVVLRPLAATEAEADALALAVMEQVNDGGEAYLTHTRLPDGRVVLRVAIGAWTTRREHVVALWALLSRTLAQERAR